MVFYGTGRNQCLKNVRTSNTLRLLMVSHPSSEKVETNFQDFSISINLKNHVFEISRYREFSNFMFSRFLDIEKSWKHEFRELSISRILEIHVFRIYRYREISKSWNLEFLCFPMTRKTTWNRFVHTPLFLGEYCAHCKITTLGVLAHFVI